MIHEENDPSYIDLKAQIVVEIVIVINTSMETQSNKNRYCQTWWLVWLKINSWMVEYGKTSMVGWWSCKLTGRLQPLDFQWWCATAGGGPMRTPARRLQGHHPTMLVFPFHHPTIDFKPNKSPCLTIIYFY